MAQIDLGQQGLTPGSSIDSLLNQHWVSGNQVTIPAGNYQINNPAQALSIDASQPSSLSGSGEVQLNVGQNALGVVDHIANGVDITFENITLKGTFTGESMLKPEVYSGATINYNNVNQPDKPQSGIAYSGFIIEANSDGGSCNWSNCNVSWATNNGIYNEGITGVNMSIEGCVFKNINGNFIQCGTSANGDRIQGCSFILAEAPLGTTPGSVCAIRQTGDGPVTVQDCDASLTWSGDSQFYATAGNNGQGTVIMRNNRIKSEGTSQVLAGPIATVEGGGNQLTGSNTTHATEFQPVVACAGANCTPPTIAEGGTEALPNTLLLENPGQTAIEFEVTVRGQIKQSGPATGADTSVDNPDNVGEDPEV